MFIHKSMKKLLLLLVVISLSGFGQTAEDYYNKGISKFNIKDYKGAISEFNKTIILNPNYADAYTNRGIAKKRTLDYTGAITDYNKAIQLNPNNSDYFYNRGIAKYNLEDYNGSISDFNKAIELDSDNSDAYTMKEDATKKLKGNLSQTNSNLNNPDNQSTKFKFDKDGFTTFVVGKCDGKSQSELYKKTINWISTFYKNPKEVTKGSIENEYIRIEGANDCLIATNLLGIHCFTSKYQLEISFKNGKYKMAILDITYFVPSSQYVIGGWHTEDLEKMSDYFKESGEIKSRYKYYLDIPIYFNKINNDLNDFLISNVIPSKKNEW